MKLSTKIPTGAQYNSLRSAVRWKEVSPEVATTALNNSVKLVSAWSDEELIGLVRVVGDGGLYYFCQDLMVDPRFQGRALSRAMIRKLKAELEPILDPDAGVAIISAAGKKRFYELFGFVAGDSEGPVMFWTKSSSSGSTQL